MKLAPHQPSLYGGPGAPTTSHGIVNNPGGGTYSEVKVGDQYTDTTAGKLYVATAVSASSVTWTVVGSQVP